MNFYTELGVSFFGDNKFGENVIFFPQSVVGRPPMAPSGATNINYNELPSLPVLIGDNCIIGSNVVIYNDVEIGANCLIGDGVCIREGVRLGNNCIIGMNAKIGARTNIGSYTRVMDLTNMASDAVIGEHVFFGPGVVMGNDNAMGRDSKFYTGHGPTIKDWATIGMNSTILPGITIGKDALVAAGSVVTKNVKAATVVMGVPARFIRELKEEEKRC